MKRRLPKAYRLPSLDETIKHQRTIYEPQIIHKAKEAGVPTPTIYLVDVANANVVMEYIEGKQVKQILNHLSQAERRNLCYRIGKLIGRLHSYGIIHGDLTTSNMILTPNGRVFFIDFGLSERTSELEAKGVDLHLMKRALQSTHYRHAKESFEAIIAGYSEVVGKDTAEKVLEKIREIERRGRYVSER
jgi:TP53 regulating kinase-like protein